LAPSPGSRGPRCADGPAGTDSRTLALSMSAVAVFAPSTFSLPRAIVLLKARRRPLGTSSQRRLEQGYAAAPALTSWNAIAPGGRIEARGTNRAPRSLRHRVQARAAR